MRTINQQGTDYPAAMLHYITALVERRDFAGAIRYYELNRSTIEQAGRSPAGAILHRAAGAYASLSNYPAALKTARMAQNLLAGEGDNLQLAELFLTLGGILRDSGDVKEAEKALRDAESIFRRNDCIEGQSRALNGLAGLFFRQQDYHNSLSVLMDAIAIARRLGDKKKLAFMMGNIGRIYTFIGSFAEARKHIQINIDLSNELRDWTEAARAYLSLAYVHIQTGEYAQAQAALEKAYPLIIEQQNRRDEVIYMTYLGELYYRSGQLDDSRNILENALTLADEIAPGTTLAGRAMRHMAELYLRLENFRSAQRYASLSLVIMEKAADKVEAGALLRIKALTAQAAGRKQEGLRCFARALDLLAESGVRFEHAEALVAAGSSCLFGPRQRINYLFRAQDFYAHNQVSRRLNEVEKLIAAIEPTASQKSVVGVSAGARAADAKDFLTDNAAIRRFKSQLPLIAGSDLPVLLTGETGVGKDHMARYFHSICRPGRPFVAVNCASVPETLLESELFGFKKGTFTGADADRRGLFLAADGGVLYLDEIGDMPLTLQAKLLGVLERRKVLPLGSTEEVTLDIKLVAATNKNLEELVDSGRFRRDLYYRLGGITFEIPPLRERKEDILLLLRHFMSHCSLLKPAEKLPSELAARFIEHDWPGNTRELLNKVKRLEVMTKMVAEGDLVELSRSIFTAETSGPANTLFERVEQFERQLLTEALLAAGGNKSEAARILGIHEATVRTKLKRYHISLEGGVAS